MSHNLYVYRSYLNVHRKSYGSLLPYPKKSMAVHANNGIVITWTKYKCKMMGIIWSYWRHGHLISKSGRCNECYWCIEYNRRRIHAKIMSKMNILKPKRVYLWTFGTSLIWSPDSNVHEYNLKTIKRYWRLFTQRMATYAKRKNFKYDPILKVIENGSMGYRYHIHALFTSYFQHERALNMWRSITGENSNVNYSGFRTKNYHKSVAYLVKYAVKSVPAEYNYMGSLLKVKYPEYVKSESCTICVKT